ncbi:MAG: NDP-sugar synthase [Candidatus Peregrinibacteria bacterium]
MQVIILAGGFATRLWPLTEKRAKPLVPLAGKPIISWMVEKIPKEFPILISTNAVFANDFEEWKKEFPDHPIEIFIEDSHGEGEKTGALAAVALCITQKNIEDNLLLLAGDNVFGFSFDDFCAQFLENPDLPILAAYDMHSLEEAKKFGVVIPDEKGMVKGFEEKPENPSSTLVSTGAYIFPKSLLFHILQYSKTHADNLGGIFEYFLQNKIPVRYFSFGEGWYDIGSFPAFLSANAEILGDRQIIGERVSLKNTELIGPVYIEDDAVLENVVLEESVVLKGATLRNTDIKHSVIGEQVTIDGIDFYGKIIRDGTFLVA